jgi:hypothetical protein
MSPAFRELCHRPITCLLTTFHVFLNLREEYVYIVALRMKITVLSVTPPPTPLPGAIVGALVSDGQD